MIFGKKIGAGGMLLSWVSRGKTIEGVLITKNGEFVNEEAKSRGACTWTRRISVPKAKRSPGCILRASVRKLRRKERGLGRVGSRNILQNPLKNHKKGTPC